MEDLRHNIERIFENQEIGELSPGYAIGIYTKKGGNFIYKGKASLENSIPISEKTKFHIASISKYFTALLFRMIEKGGLINENDLVSTYFPLAIFKNNKITFRHLLTHTSGLRDQWDLTQYAGWRRHDPITNEDILHLVGRQNDLSFKPGSFYCYCNTGYTLTGLALEKVTGQSIRTLLKSHITGQLNLKDTGYYSYDEIIDDFANGYGKTGSGEYRINKPSFDVIGSTSMFSSITDLLVLEKAHHDNEFVGLFTSDFFRNNSETKPGQVFYHDGLIHTKLEGVEIQLHSGWDYGYSSFLLRMVNIGCSIVILSNMGEPRLFDYAMKVAEAIVSRIEPPNNIPTGSFFKPPLTIRPDIRTGYFINPESSNILKLELIDDKLTLEGESLNPLSKNSYKSNNSVNILKIVSNSAFVMETMGFSIRYDHLGTSIAIDSPDQYTGMYYSKELDAYYEIFLEKNSLMVGGRKFKTWKLVSITSENFKSDSFSIKFEIDKNHLAGFYLSTPRSWNIYFNKIN